MGETGTMHTNEAAKATESTPSAFAARFRQRVQARIGDEHPASHRLAALRVVWPGPMAIVDALVGEAERIFPHASISVSGIARRGWKDMTEVRISARQPKGAEPKYVSFFTNASELVYAERDGAGMVIPQDHTAWDASTLDVADDSAFALWLEDMLCSLLVEDLKFYPLGLCKDIAPPIPQRDTAAAPRNAATVRAADADKAAA